VLANMDSNLLALMNVSIHQNPLNEIVAVLISSNIDERNARTIRPSSSDDSKIAIQEVQSANLEALLNNLGGKLIDAVVIRVGQDVVNDATLVRGRAVLTEVLDTPVSELAVSDEINVGDYFLDSRALNMLV
jgi:hypothetical protein